MAQVAVLALLAATVSTVGSHTSVAHADPIARPRTPNDASAQAAATGQPVEVSAETTETTQVMANPDGSFTLTSNREPVRVDQGGQWTPIDTTLVRNGDGTLSPRATLTSLTFSGGGNGPALSIADPDGNQISFSWPTPLPTPSIDQNTATYADVLPGVDLKLTAQAQSYSEVLVVKDATAAADPNVAHLKLQATASGLSLSQSNDGGLQATDDSGAVVFAGTTPAMWDSTSNPAVGPEPTADDPGSAPVIPLAVTVPTTDGTDTDASAQITITPPAQALAGSDVQYPVFIDPMLSKPERQPYAVVLSAGASYYNDPNQDMKVGYCGWSDCNGIGIGRSYFNFDTTAITRHDSWQNTTAHIFAAAVTPYETHNAAGCTTEPVDLYIASTIDANTTWPGPLGGFLQEVSSNRSDTCATTSANSPGLISFAGQPVLDRVQSAANSGTIALGFALVSPDTTDRNQWKRFSINPTLTVTYNFPPSAPLATGITGSVTCNGSTYTADSTPTLHGQAHDNNSPHTALDLRYNIYPIAGGSPAASSSDVLANSDADATWPSSTALSDGAWKYTVNAHFASANFYIDLWTGESGPYPFVVEQHPPATMPLIASADYPQNYWGSVSTGSTHGAFVLNTNGGGNAIGFAYAFDGTISAPTTCTPVAGDRWLLATGGTATLTAPILSPGPHTLTVRTFNHVHALSSQMASYTFYVSPFGAGNRTEAESSALTYGGAASQTMTDLYRYVSSNDHASSTSGASPGTGYTQESALGLLSTTPATGTTALYDCLNGSDHFSSTSTTSEGKPIGHLLGYIYTTQPAAPPTHPVYRCLATEHFDSTTSNCEGNTVEGTLGYAMDMPAATTTPTLTNTSSGYQLRLIATTAIGQQATITFTPTIGADYAIGAELNTNASNGIVDFTANGVELGRDGTPGPVDTSSTTAAESYVQLGGAHFEAGVQQTLTITVNAAGAHGGGFETGLDYLTLAPVNNVTSVPNNHGISNDGTATTANFNAVGTTQSLSATALSTAGLGAGAVTTISGATFTMEPAINGNDNTITDGSNLAIDRPLTGATYLDLLVASTGQPSPANDANYPLNINYDDGILAQDRLPSVPLWTTLDNSTVTSSSGVLRTPAVTLDHYNVGVNATNSGSPAYLYLLKIPLTDPSGQNGNVQSITFPPAQTTGGALHILAITTS